MARSFNGTTDMIAADAAHTYTSTVAFSVSLWMKNNSSASGSCFYSEGNSGSANNYLQLFESTGKTGYRIRESTSTFALSIAGAASTFDGSLHHILFTQDGAGNYVAYVDGVSDSSGTYATANPPTTNQVGIGLLRRNTNSAFFAGVLAEVAKWSRQLSSGEAASLGAGLPASFLAPDHYWPLWGIDSPEPDIGVTSHVTGTLTGTAYTNGGRVNADLLTI